MWNLYLLRKFIEFRLTYKKHEVEISTIQVNSWKKSNFWKAMVGHCEKKKVQINACLILNGYRDKAVWINK